MTGYTPSCKILYIRNTSHSESMEWVGDGGEVKRCFFGGMFRGEGTYPCLEDGS